MSFLPFSKKYVDVDFYSSKNVPLYSIRTTDSADGQKVSHLHVITEIPIPLSNSRQEPSSSLLDLKTLKSTRVASITWSKKRADIRTSLLRVQYPDGSEQQTKLHEVIICSDRSGSRTCTFYDRYRNWDLSWERDKNIFQLKDGPSKLLGHCGKMPHGDDRYYLMLRLEPHNTTNTSPEFYAAIMALYCLMTSFDALRLPAVPARAN